MSRSLTPSLPQLSPVARYALAPASVLVAFLIQWLLLPEPHIAPFVFFYAAIVVASLFGGRGPGMTAVVLSAAVANFAFLHTHLSWSTSAEELAATGLFFVASTLVALLCASLRGIASRNQQLAERFRQQADMLDRDVAARKQAEEQVNRLNESLARQNLELDAERARWRGVVEGIADEVWVCDAQGDITLVNLPEVTATELDASNGAGFKTFLETVEFLTADGSPRPFDQSPLLLAIRERHVVRGEELMRNRQTGAIRHRQFTSAPMRDRAGEVTGAVAVVRDITDLRLAEKALREADRRKNEFLAMLAHELRNPLAPIATSLRVLDHAPPGGTQAQRACGIIDRQVAHMTRLVDELLDVSRITSGKIRLQRDLLDLGEVVGDTLDDYRPLFTDKAIALESVIPEEPLHVDGDRVRIAQAFGNTLQNAAKFTPTGGKVRVALSSQGDWAVLTVSDTGVGISPDVIAHVFEPFTQADRTLDRAAGGLGLGLSLVKGLIELHRGEVKVSSDGPGKGAELMIRLPRHLSSVASVRPVESTQRRRRRLLVIEDNVDAAQSLQDVLELDGHEVAVSHSGADGLAKARETVPEVVLCDIGLPGMDGYETARAFREDDQLCRVVLVALTGYAGSDDRQKAEEAGFDHHLAKPLDFRALERILARLPQPPPVDRA